MALPKINQPIYKHYLKGLKKEIEFKPFTVAEQKILLLAKQEKDKKQILTSIEQILKNCILTKDFDVLDLPHFDMEDIFIRIRAKSVGEVIETRYEYEYKDPETEEIKKDDFVLKINTDDIQVKDSDIEDTIILQENPTIGIKLKYPTLRMYKESEDIEDGAEIILNCIESIFDDEQVYTDFTKKELEEFVDELDALNFKKIENFFDNMPSIHHEVEVIMPKTKEKKTIVFNNLADFFF